MQALTGPETEKARGWWVTTGIHSPNRVEVDDGFADENGEPQAEMGMDEGMREAMGQLDALVADRVGD